MFAMCVCMLCMRVYILATKLDVGWKIESGPENMRLLCNMEIDSDYINNKMEKNSLSVDEEQQ